MSGIKQYAAAPLLAKHPRLRFIDGAPDGAAGAVPPAPVPTPPQEPAPATPAAFNAPTSQEELDRIVQSRVSRVQAKYADYDTLKAAADKYAEHEESQKTELQKATDRADGLEASSTKDKAELARYQVAQKHGITERELSLLTGTTSESLEAQAEAILGIRGPVGPVVPKPDPSIGPKTPAAPRDLSSAVKSHYGAE